MRTPDIPPVAGADVGGGSVKYGILAEGGTVVFRDAFPTSPTPERTFEELRRRLREASASAGVEPRRLGVALPGPLPADRAALGELPNLPAWSGWPVRERLSALFGLPVAVENDANAAAFAEAHLGAGRGCRTVLLLTLGTGVGGGIVHEGRLFLGSAGAAAEIGHLTVQDDGPFCPCGKRGCLEALVGSRALRASYAARAGLASPPPLSEVISLARRGDETALAVFRRAGAWLGVAVAAAANILNPDCVLIGGGVAAVGGPLLEAVRASAVPRVMPALRNFRLAGAALGNDAGFIGAALLAAEEEG